MGDKSGDESPADAEDSPSQPAAGEFSAMATSPPLVENGYEVVGPTLRKPANPHPGQRYLDTDLDTYSIYNGTSWLSVNTSAGIGVIDDIGDVTITGSAEVGQFLGWDGDEWSNLTIGLDDLDDVEIATPDATHVLKRSGSGWANARLSTADLSDILLTAPSDGQFLRYDSGLGKIVNETVQIPEDYRSFVVTAYGAKGDGAADDTAEIQATFDAARAYTAANPGAAAEVVFPRGVYVVSGEPGPNGKCLVLGNDMSPIASNLFVSGPATIKLADGEDGGVIFWVADHGCTVKDLTIDGNNAGTPTGRCEALRVTGNDATLDGVICQNTSATSTAGNTFQISGQRARVLNCTSLNSGENGIRIGGDYAYVENFRALGFRNKGLTCNNSENSLNFLAINGYYAESNTTAAAANGLQVDLMGGGFGSGRIIKHVSIKNAVVRMTAESGPTVATKFAKIGRLELDNVRVEHATTNMASIKLTEGIGSVRLTNCTLEGSINQDPSAQGANDSYGAIASVADNGSGKCRFTITGGTNVKTGDWLYIVNSSGDPEYDGIHEVVGDSEGGATFDTSRDFTDDATGAYYSCIPTLTVLDSTIGFRTKNPQACLDDLRVSRLTVHRSHLIGFSARGIEFQDPEDSEQFPTDCIESIDVQDTLFESNASSANYALRISSNTIDWGTTSGKVRWRNNKLTNAGSQPLELARRQDVMVMLTANGGPRDYYADALPTGAPGVTNSAVTWQVGDRFWRTNAPAGQSPGWICTAAGTFSTGSFKRMAPIGILASDIAEVANVGSGEDDLMSYALPAGTLAQNGMSVEIDCGFTFAANSNNKRVKVYWGDEPLYDSGDAAQNGGSLAVRITLVYGDGILGKYWTQANASPSGAYASSGAAGTISLNPNNAITIKGTGEADNDGDVVMEFLRAKLMPGP